MARPVGRADGLSPVHVRGAFEPSPKSVAFTSPPVFEEVGSISVHPTGVVPAALFGPGAVAEEFRTLAAHIRALDAQRPFRCFGIVSAVVGEGKTIVAGGLATALAQNTGRVLLVESDLRRAALDTYFGLPRSAGLSEWLHDGVEPVAVGRVLPPGFFLLAAGQSLKYYARAAFAESRDVARMRALIEGARRLFDFVIVDCPPLMPVADAIILQEFLDGFLVVVRERYAPLETVLRGVDRLDPERLRGVVLNDHLEVLRRYSKYQNEYYRDRA